MAVPEPNHNRVATAVLFVVFIVATMVVSLAVLDVGQQRDRATNGADPGAASAPDSVSCPAPIALQAPSPDLAAAVAAQPPGTCFLLEPGTYRFHDVVPKDGMVFVGESTESVVVDGNGRENAFHGTADGVTIAQMTFRDFNASGGTTRQEQAPIRGTAALWASDRGTMATNWLVTDVVSAGNYASGIFLGEHWTVRNSVFHSNGVTGIGGDHLVGGLIESNIVHSNGSEQAAGAAVNGGGLKITQAGTPQHPVVVRNNEFYQNTKIAIWCDIGCDGFHVIDNYVHDHVSRGVMYELSSNLVVRGNTFLRSNTWTDFGRDFNAGAVTVGESRDVLIENNNINDARAGVVVRQTKRPASGEGFLSGYPYVNYVSSNITVRNNVVENTEHMGISLGTSGAGLLGDPASIVFSDNTYKAPAEMSFWWNDGQRLSHSDWQAAGRDLAGGGTQPSPPAGEGRGPTDGVAIETTTTTAPAPPPTETPVSLTAPAPSTTEPSTTGPSTTEPASAELPTTEVAVAAPTSTEPPASVATTPPTTLPASIGQQTGATAAEAAAPRPPGSSTTTMLDPGNELPGVAGHAGPQRGLALEPIDDSAQTSPSPRGNRRTGVTGSVETQQEPELGSGVVDGAEIRAARTSSETTHRSDKMPRSAMDSSGTALESLGLPLPEPDADASGSSGRWILVALLAPTTLLAIGAGAVSVAAGRRAARLSVRRG